MSPAFDKQVSRPVESGLSSALRPRPVTGTSLQKKISKIAVKNATAHRAGDNALRLVGGCVASIGLSELRHARRLNKVTAVANAICGKRSDNGPTLHSQALVIKQEFRIVDSLGLFDAGGQTLVKLDFNGSDALVDFGSELVDAALLLIVTGLSIGDAPLGGRNVVHRGDLIVLGCLEIVIHKIYLDGILLIFLVGFKARLGKLKLTDFLLETTGFLFETLNAVLGVLEPLLGGDEIGTYARKSGGLEGFAAREILKFNFKLTDTSVNFLQIKQRFYNRHLIGPFRSGAGDGTRTRNPQNHNLMI